MRTDKMRNPMSNISVFTKSWKRKLQKGVVFAACAAIALWFWLAAASPPAAAASFQEGEAIFQQSCASCHTADGSSAAFGPDLKGIINRRDRDWLVQWISAPEKVLASGDAIAGELLQKYSGVPMPNMGLQPAQVESVLAYLGGESEGQAATVATPQIATGEVQPAQEVKTGDPQIGEKLFTGAIAFEKRAPACMSCHTVNSVGALRGGTLGPNLTQVFGRYGEIGLSSVLQTLPFPTMQGIYENRLLTEEEQAHLKAFFAQANAREESRAQVAEATAPNQSSFLQKLESFHLTPSWIFGLIGFGGFLLLALLSNFIWRDRFTGVRQRLVGGKQ